uniref:Uncharacterized protein n=1 Tax=viral metagenome TaxID=1070528 RepID=A0A6M3J3F8_9ZZZZ
MATNDDLQTLYDQDQKSGILAQPALSPKQGTTTSAQQPDDLSSLYDQDVKAGTVPATTLATDAAQAAPMHPSQLATYIAANHPTLSKMIIGAGTGAKDLYGTLKSMPLVGNVLNAGISAGQTESQMMDNAINMASQHHLLSRLVNAASLGVKTAPGSIVSQLETKIAQEPLEAPQVATPGISSAIGKIAGITVPLVASGSLGEAALGAIPGAAKGLSAIPMVGKYMPGVIGRALGTAAVSPTLSATTSPGTAAATGAVGSVLGDIGAGAIGAAAGPAWQVLKGAAGKVMKVTPQVQQVLRSYFKTEAQPHIAAYLDSILTTLKGSSTKESAGQDLYDMVHNKYRALMGEPGTIPPPQGTIPDAYDAVSNDAPFDQSNYNQIIQKHIDALQTKMAPLAAPQTKQLYQEAINRLTGLRKARLRTIGDAQTHGEALNDMLSDPNTSPYVKKAVGKLKTDGIYGNMPDDVSADMPFDRSNYNNILQQHIDELRDNILSTKALIKPYSDDITTLQGLGNAEVTTVGAAKTVKEVINDMLRDPTKSKDVKDALRELKNEGIYGSMGDAQDQMGIEDLQALQAADQRYKTEVVPFRKQGEAINAPKTGYWKRKKSGTNQEMMWRDYLKPGAAGDNVSPLENFVKVMPEDNAKNLLLYNYLKDTEGNPTAMLAKWNKLGEGQKNLLLPENKNMLDQYAALAKNPAYKGMFALQPENKIAEYGPSIGAGGAAVALFTGHPLAAVGALIPAIKRVLGKGIFSNPANVDLLTRDLAKAGIIDSTHMPAVSRYLRAALLGTGATALTANQ